MQTPRNFLIGAIIIISIGVGLYFIIISVFLKTPETTPTTREVPLAPPAERWEYQGMKYEIISTGVGEEKARGAVHDIITGKLREEQVKTLSEKIVGDIAIKNPKIKDLTLLFYSGLISAGAGKYDVARIFWTPTSTAVTMAGK